MPKPTKAVQSATLPQYQMSPAFMERFIDAAHSENAEIERSQNAKGIKLVDGSEISADSLDYFLDKKAEMEAEFLSDLTDEIGSTKAVWFCDVIAKDWYDGKGLRNGPRVLDVKLSVREWLVSRLRSGASLGDVVVHPEINCSANPTLSSDEVDKILYVNHRMLIKHVEAWKDVHENAQFISDDDIFLRRGLCLTGPIDTSLPYKEWDYVNSYSIAFSAPEKFAQMTRGGTPAIVNGDLHLFDHRVLFFSPFVPGMAVGQLEFGVIPGRSPEPIKHQGEHGGIQEYVIGERPD
ncbi:hypothetical protein [Caulobacter sp. 17J80-11]|uniref:hypothetical protein n=1 Tax=Caulobacter sp. 17J80-11 TaxID=2763502 RepID=UPI00165394C3|nr:hypothetical protein [Caulobacter sp. 17J80-11]MBC6982868.1 hypothetical protein [Caulobacter sp. 17J80-11]